MDRRNKPRIDDYNILCEFYATQHTGMPRV